MDGLEAQIKDVDSRLDKHLEIYANNGKELARLGNLLEQHMADHKDTEKKVQEMYDVFIDGRGGVKVIKILFGILVAIGSAILMVKGIFK